MKISAEIMYLDQKKEQQYFEVTSNTVLVGSSPECQITLEKHPGICEKHLLFSYEVDNGRFSVKNIGDEPVFANNTTLEPSKKVFLGYKSFFILGDKSSRGQCQPIVFLDNSQETQEDTHVKSLKVKKAIPKEMEVEVSNLVAKFYDELQNIQPTTKDVCKYFVKFLADRFSASTIVLYKRSGTAWQSMAVFRSNKRETYRPSTTLFQRAIETKTPIFFKIEADTIEVGKDILSSSVSIVESGARRVIIIPLVQDKRCFGMLYLDGKDSELITDHEFNKLVYSLVSGGIQSTLSGYLAEDLEQLNLLPITPKSLPSKWDWRVFIANHHIHYPVVSFKCLENAGRARLLYGTVGNDLEKAVQMKFLIDGMQEVGIKTTNPQDFTSIVDDYLDFRRDPTKTLETLKICDFFLSFVTTLEVEDEDLQKIVLSKDEKKNDENSMRVKFTEGMYVCTRYHNKIEDLDRNASVELMNMLPLDFVLGSTYNIPRHIQKYLCNATDVNSIISKLKATVKDFVLFIRER